MAYLPQTLRCGNHDYAVTVRKRRGTRRLSMRFDALGQQIIITAPVQCNQRQIARFISSHHQAMAKHITSQPRPSPLTHGARITLLGNPYMIAHESGETDGIEHLLVMAPPSKLGKQLRSQLQALLLEHTHTVLEALWRSPEFNALQRPTQIRFRDTRSRWGSCSHDGRIMLSWRLIFMPEYVARYVIIHECCHLIHHNHSPAFWGLCHSHCYETDRAKTWLKQHGSSVFAYQL